LITAFQANAFQNNAFQIGGITPVVTTDTHDGVSEADLRKYRERLREQQRRLEAEFEEEVGKQAKRRQQVIDALKPAPPVHEPHDQPPEPVEAKAEIAEPPSLVPSLEKTIQELDEVKRALIQSYRGVKQAEIDRVLADDEQELMLMASLFFDIDEETEQSPEEEAEMLLAGVLS
jgi:hypothetical protein